MPRFNGVNNFPLSVLFAAFPFPSTLSRRMTGRLGEHERHSRGTCVGDGLPGRVYDAGNYRGTACGGGNGD